MVLKLFMVGKEFYGNNDTSNINKMLIIHVLSFNEFWFWVVFFSGQLIYNYLIQGGVNSGSGMEKQTTSVKAGGTVQSHPTTTARRKGRCCVNSQQQNNQHSVFHCYKVQIIQAQLLCAYVLQKIEKYFVMMKGSSVQCGSCLVKFVI